MDPDHKISPTVLERRLPGAVALAAAVIIAAFPVFDVDLYWHLANGRVMADTGRIVGEEVFSYTHRGQAFVNHEWLSQTVFYLLWDRWGPDALWGFKLVLVAVTALVSIRAAGMAGASAWNASLVGVAWALAGISRFHVRPELFTLLCASILILLMHRFRAGRMRRFEPAILPPLFILWDWLHGAIIGLALLLVFAAGENLRSRFPGCRGPGPDRPGLKRLNLWVGITVLAMAWHPFGLRTYGHFLTLARGAEGADRIFELQPVWHDPGLYFPYLVILGLTLGLTGASIRRVDAGQLLLVLTFGLGPLFLGRLVGVGAMVLAPFLAVRLTDSKGPEATGPGAPAARYGRYVLIGAVLLFGFKAKILDMAATTTPEGTFRLPSPWALGRGVDEFRTPAGSVRFLADRNLQGNLYNNANLGGYLAYHLAPDRPIFQYNMPPIFGDTTRFVRRPGDLDRWNIAYALAGSAGELTRLFPGREWAWVYSDYVSTLVVRRTPENRDLIDTYEIRFFSPEQSSEEFRLMSRNRESLPRLAFEMGVYLAYMTDRRIADRWESLMRRHPELRRYPGLDDLMPKIAARNATLAALVR